MHCRLPGIIRCFTTKQQSALSNEVKEVQKVEGCGTFTAYQDGRIRVVFLTVPSSAWTAPGRFAA